MNSLVIGVVGPCGSGKTTLVNGLKKLNYQVKHIAQEHSYVATMWKKIANPDVMVYLDVSYANTVKRRQLRWTEHEYKIQLRRLEHARQNAHFYICTDLLTPEDVLEKVLDFLKDFEKR